MRWLPLLLLCAAYLQGPASKLYDYPAADRPAFLRAIHALLAERRRDCSHTSAH